MKTLVTLFLGMILAAPAHAYIDPNIGGQLYQALYPILAVLLGILAFARQWVAALWQRTMAALRALVGRNR